MDDSKKKCTSKEHENIEANSYCHECKIYICKKCENIHSILFQNHHVSKTSEDLTQIFTGLCKVEHHSEKLKYFCKTHNVLCCAQCITKIKDDENGQHKDCKICLIDDIKDVKKNNLSENLKSLENFSLSLQDSIKEIKIIFEKINENKENIKMKIQKIFTKIRNQVNKREDEILLKVDEKFGTLFFKEDMVKDCDKLPSKIEMSLQKGKIINDNWNDQNKINSLINDCIIIENNIKYIKDLDQIMRKCKSINLNVEFIPKKRGISSLLKTIKTFGGIKFNNFKFKKCPEDISKNREYEVSGEDENILTKTGTDEEWMGTICENKLDISKECIWKIKVFETEESKIMMGVASEDFDIKSSLYDNCGWYYYLYDNSLISESTKDIKSKDLDLNKIKQKKKKDISSDSESDSEEICKKKKKIKDMESSDSEDEKVNRKKRSKKEESSDSEKDTKNKRKKKSKKEESSDSEKKCKKDERKKKEESESEEEDFGKDKKMPISEEDSEESEKNEDKNIEEDEEVIQEIIVILNFEKKSLKFLKNNEIKGEYSDINTDKPLFPAIFLYNTHDCIKIEGFN